MVINKHINGMYTDFLILEHKNNLQYANNFDKFKSSKCLLTEKLCFLISYFYNCCLTQCQAKRLLEDFSSSVATYFSLWFCLPNVVAQDFATVIIFNRTQVSFFIVY